MTVREYISQKLAAFGLTEAHYADIVHSSGICLDDVYSSENADLVGAAMIPVIEELMFIPRQSNISESGFSMSWDFSGLGKWYMLLCRRYGKKVDDDILAQSGISVICDKTSVW